MLPPVAREWQYIAERQDGHGLLTEVNSERLLLTVSSYTQFQESTFRLSPESSYRISIVFNDSYSS